MSWINNQVTLGDPLLVHPQPRRVNLTPFLYGSRMGVVPGMDSGPQVSPLAIGGFVIGGGLIVGGIFVKGPGGVVMSIVGGISAGFSLITTLMGLMGPSQPSGMTPAKTTSFAPPKPQAPASRTQQIQQYAAMIAPGAVDILSKLLAPSKTTPAIPGLPTAPAPAPAPAPASAPLNIVTSL